MVSYFFITLQKMILYKLGWKYKLVYSFLFELHEVVRYEVRCER